MPLTLFLASTLRSLTMTDLSSFQNVSSFAVSTSSMSELTAFSAVLDLAALPGLAHSSWLG